MNEVIKQLAKKYSFELNSSNEEFIEEVFAKGVIEWRRKCTEGMKKAKAEGKILGRGFGNKDKKKRDSTKMYKRVLLKNKHLMRLDPKTKENGLAYINKFDKINKQRYKIITTKIKGKLKKQLKKQRDNQ
jgi:hypothetical protein